MKYQKVRSLIIGFVFSVSAMTACGVYGGMETASVYGSAESSTEEVWRQMDDRSMASGYNEETNTDFEYQGINFHLPYYMQDGVVGEDGSVTFTVSCEGEETPSQIIFSCFSFKERYPDYTDADDWDTYEKTVEVIESWTWDKTQEEREGLQTDDEEILSSVFSTADMFDVFNHEEFSGDIYRIVTNLDDQQSQWYCGLFPMEDGDHFIQVLLKENSRSLYNYEDDMRMILDSAGL